MTSTDDYSAQLSVQAANECTALRRRLALVAVETIEDNRGGAQDISDQVFIYLDSLDNDLLRRMVVVALWDDALQDGASLARQIRLTASQVADGATPAAPTPKDSTDRTVARADMARLLHHFRGAADGRGIDGARDWIVDKLLADPSWGRAELVAVAAEMLAAVVRDLERRNGGR